MEYIPQNQIKNYRESNTPNVCPISKVKSDNWVVDHDHQTGQIRGVIDSEANVFLGAIENRYKRLSKGKKVTSLVDMLEGIVAYLNAKQTGILHPVGLTQLCKRFNNNLTSEGQKLALQKLGAKKSEILACNNSKNRTALYRSLLKQS